MVAYNRNSAWAAATSALGLLLVVTLVSINVVATTVRPLSLEAKVSRSKAILQVTITGAVAARANPILNPLFPATNNLASPIVCTAKVSQVLKGPTNLTEVEFRSVPFPSSFVGNMEDLVGRECLVFLEERHIGEPQPQLWLFQQPRLLAYEYTEYGFDNGRPISEKYSHSNYVAKIRVLSTQ
jgi:hypothetical protein